MHDKEEVKFETSMFTKLRKKNSSRFIKTVLKGSVDIQR